MKEMPDHLKELQERLGESDFSFIDSGEQSLSDDVYPAVKDEFPRLCDDSIKCEDIGKGGASTPEWQHRVRTVLHRLADDSSSRVEKSETHGMWRFE